MLNSSKYFLLISFIICHTTLQSSDAVSPKSRGQRKYVRNTQFQRGFSTEAQARAFIELRVKAESKAASKKKVSEKSIRSNSK